MTILAFLLLFCTLSAQSHPSQKYSKSYVSEERLSRPRIETLSLPFSNNEETHVRILSVCRLLPWCEAVCLPTSGEAVLTDLYINGGITDTMAGNKVPCFTSRAVPLYPNSEASVKASPTRNDYPARVIEQMQDGVYGFDIEECFSADSDSNPYIVVEIPESRNITSISFRTQPYGYIGDKFHKFVVRVGDIEPVPKDFSGLSFFAEHEGGTSQLNIDLVLESVSGVVGKYISIHETTTLDHSFQVCAIEVFGN